MGSMSNYDLIKEKSEKYNRFYKRTKREDERRARERSA